MVQLVVIGAEKPHCGLMSSLWTGGMWGKLPETVHKLLMPWTYLDEKVMGKAHYYMYSSIDITHCQCLQTAVSVVLYKENGARCIVMGGLH